MAHCAKRPVSHISASGREILLLTRWRVLPPCEEAPSWLRFYFIFGGGADFWGFCVVLGLCDSQGNASKKSSRMRACIRTRTTRAYARARAHFHIHTYKCVPHTHTRTHTRAYIHTQSELMHFNPRANTHNPHSTHTHAHANTITHARTTTRRT